MNGKIISFRAGPELTPMILAESHRRGGSVSEYMNQLIYGAMQMQEDLQYVQQGLVRLKSLLIEGEDPEDVAELIDTLIERIDD